MREHSKLMSHFAVNFSFSNGILTGPPPPPPPPPKNPPEIIKEKKKKKERQNLSSMNVREKLSCILTGHRRLGHPRNISNLSLLVIKVSLLTQSPLPTTSKRKYLRNNPNDFLIPRAL